VAIGRLGETAGLGDHVALAVGALRLIGMIAAGAIGLVLLYRSNRRTSALAIAFSFFAVILLGPVIQPWYIAWGLVMLAVAARGRLLAALCICTFVAAFFPPPGGTVFVDDLSSASPAFLAATGLTLLAVIALIFGPGAWTGRRDRDEELAAAQL
jgi:alpha-1,6-mannosyltransferase